MIRDQDRRVWIGASDSSYVVGNWTTESFLRWWESKIGMAFAARKWGNKYTNAGTYYEHAILDTIPGITKDEVVEIPELNLRVNYDGTWYGDQGCTIYEVKTYTDTKDFKVSKAYWRQAQVEMFAKNTTRLYILAYPMSEEHYKDYFLPIDKAKRQMIRVEYDPEWIAMEYLPKLKYVSDCIKAGRLPQEAVFEAHIVQKGKGMPDINKGKKICLSKR